jgi:hypothetical protein
VKISRKLAKRHIRRGSGLAIAAVRGMAFLLMIAACVVGLRWISATGKAYVSNYVDLGKSSSFQFADGQPSNGIQPRNRRLVYPYSVIPGGVRSGDELREIVRHDPVVAEHYSGFDFSHAHVVEVEHPKLVYVSYRRGGQIHWSSKQATLRTGEKLLTDGRITARTRCGNQVSVLPKHDTTPNEPTMAELERPDAVASGREQLFPESANALHLDPLLPIAPPYAGFPQPGPFIPLPFGGSPGNPKPSCKVTVTNDCKKTPPPPPPVPEPGSFVLVLSGAAALYARVRMRRA